MAVNGGHLASNLGTVELTIALHHVFNSPEDKLIWDVSHQTYSHKILTGAMTDSTPSASTKDCAALATLKNLPTTTFSPATLEQHFRWDSASSKIATWPSGVNTFSPS